MSLHTAPPCATRCTAADRGARLLAGLAVSAISAAVTVAPAAASTTVTEYTYNADGAPTSMTITADDGATTTYLTWDNFVPDVDDPTSGMVAQGNGHLLGSGAAPGVADANATFAFDRRERLLSYSGTDSGETYDYYANGMMSSAATSAGSFRFFYDRAKNPHVTNVRDDAGDLWSAYLDHVRYLDDGSEQVLLMPRKDLACSYDATMQSVDSYTYDAYGTELDAAPPGALELRDNPFRYAGEYRDPLWGGYYLRARWYWPQLNVFLSRDGMPGLNRYGYAGGNPVMRVDPGGKSYHGYMKAIGRPLGHFLAEINKGPGGHFARLFLSPILGPLQILAAPKAFWETLRHDKNGTDIFLVAGVAAAEALNLAEGYFGAGYVNQFFAARVLTALTLGTAQTTVIAAARGFNHFNWNTFLQGEEGVVGSTFEISFVGGKGYNRFNRTGGEIAELVSQLDETDPDTVLIVRQRTNLRVGPAGKSIPLRMQTGPIQEAMGLGVYHEQILALTRDDIFTTEVVDGFVQPTAVRGLGLRGVQESLRTVADKDFEVIGTVSNFDRSRGFEDFGIENFWTGRDYLIRSGTDETNPYRTFTNNSHHHAALVLKQLGLR